MSSLFDAFLKSSIVLSQFVHLHMVVTKCNVSAASCDQRTASKDSVNNVFCELRYNK